MGLKWVHDDVIKWKHFPCYWPFVRGILRSPVNPPHKGQWRGTLMFSLICAHINGWANNGDAGDLRQHLAHYDVIVMEFASHTSRVFCGVLFWFIVMFFQGTYAVNSLVPGICGSNHWNENVVILTKFSSLAALEVVILTTFSAASDENFIKMKTFPFQWCWKCNLRHVTDWALLVKLLSGECHRRPLMINQLWFRWWLGADRKQAITWADADLDLCRHMTPMSWYLYIEFRKKCLRLQSAKISFFISIYVKFVHSDK